MSMTDPIADMLTRIRNAAQAGHKNLIIPASGLKEQLARVLKEEGYIIDYSSTKDSKQGLLKVILKYAEDEKSVITKISRISKPGLRRYVGKDDIPKVLNGLGISILSTSSGIMTDKSARKLGVGGELLCLVY
ncbi:MAG: 30S ribosomal protein S8 [Proteobacteria bacterium]|nr:30S ribosomal protein S8 [Pseudomonadota bacterium]